MTRDLPVFSNGNSKDEEMIGLCSKTMWLLKVVRLNSVAKRTISDPLNIFKEVLNAWQVLQDKMSKI